MGAMSRLAVETAVVDPQTEWTRRRLQVLLGGCLAVALALVAGAVWSVASLVTGASAPVRDPEPAPRSAQDRLASEPLPEAPLAAAQPGSISSGESGTLQIPAPTRVGELGVATGFPRTPEGALAQLAAIDATALSSASVRVAQEVIVEWAAPGGPTAESWTGVQAVATLLASAGMSADARDGALTIAAEPKMGLVKGTAGEGFVVPCIDFIVTATIAGGAPQRVAAADCQRMVWQGDRWLIGPGDEPAPAPSLWPGSQASFDAGYQWLEVPQS